MADSPFTHPRDIYHGLGLGYDGSEFSPDMTEVYMLRWRAVGAQAYRALPQTRGNPPSTGDYVAAAPEGAVTEYFVDAVPVPVGAEIHRISAGQEDFIARYDGQIWLRPQ